LSPDNLPTIIEKMVGEGDEEALVGTVPGNNGRVDRIVPPSDAYGTFFKKSMKIDTPRQGVCGAVVNGIAKLAAIIIIVLVTIMDVLPYGLLIFPTAFGLPDLNIAGVQMVLFCTAVCQTVLAFMSGLPPATGCMIVENVPFLHTMTTNIVGVLQQ